MKTKAKTARRAVYPRMERRASLSARASTSHRQGYVVGRRPACGETAYDVTGAGNDCPLHSYGYILSLEESALTRVA
ncbi:unnamed protein product [Arctia plantaginis]|uniref:Uncharacterized protein n=1 Tax=Arctia plantaginis TaxID=874455 RepID=A0A8S1BK95_ARCPL|nr:unnamed protein product [Arctia plantaginis]CAB3260521.1 unnamed protein product [Arctia plantaginis]